MNPAVLGLPATLSVNADLTLGLQSPYNNGSPLSQLSFGFNSRFFAFGYQFDRFEDQVGGSGIIHAHTYRFALWGTDGRLGAGATATLYRGGDGGTAYDFGVAYRLAGALDLGAVLANVGQPTVRGTDLRVSWRPAATFHLGRLAAVQAQADAGNDQLRGFAFGGQLRLGTPRMPLLLNARLDTDRDFKRQAFTFGLTLGGENRGAAFFTTSGDLKDGEALSVHGVSERSNRPSRRR